jgi:hypothetical protein
MAKNPLFFGFPNTSAPTGGGTASRLSYPMLMAILGASQGANNTGSDWVDLGNGFRAYDNSPKRALMGLAQGGAGGYMQGVLQQRLAASQQAKDESRRQEEAERFKAELGLKTEAEKELIAKREDAKILAETDPRILSRIAMEKGYPNLDALFNDEKAARDLARKLKINEDTRATYKMQDETDKLNAEQETSRAKLQQAAQESPLRLDKLKAEAEYLRAGVKQRERPKAPREMAVSRAKALATAEAAIKYGIPEGEVEWNKDASLEAMRLMQKYLNSLPPETAATTAPDVAPVSSLFK